MSSPHGKAGSAGNNPAPIEAKDYEHTAEVLAGPAYPAASVALARDRNFADFFIRESGLILESGMYEQTDLVELRTINLKT